MKYCSIVIVALLLTAAPAIAQKKSLRKFYREQRKEAFGMRIGIGRLPLTMAAWIVPKSITKEDGIPLKELLSKMQKVKIYMLEGYDSAVSVSSIERLKSSLKEKDGFEPLIEVREKGTNIFVMNKGREDELGDVVMLVQDNTDFLILSLRTKLLIKDVNMLIKGVAKN